MISGRVRTVELSVHKTSDGRQFIADTREPFEAACCLGMDALRISLGHPPKSYSRETIAAWFAFLASRPLDGKP